MNKTIKGTVVKKYGANAIMLNLGGYGNNKMFSQYGGIDVPLEEGHLVEFEYTEKEKDGKIYNNIVAGTMKVVGMKPKDISSNYRPPVADKDPTGHETIAGGNLPSKDTLIVRQSCLKAAVEYAQNVKIIMNTSEPQPELIHGWQNILKTAEEFEKWVFR